MGVLDEFFIAPAFDLVMINALVLTELINSQMVGKRETIRKSSRGSFCGD
jgi:hypothetical protein